MWIIVNVSVIFLKVSKKVERHFIREDSHLANKYMKKCSTSVNRKMQIKIRMVISVTTYSLEWLKLKGMTKSNIDKVVGWLELPYISGVSLK